MHSTKRALCALSAFLAVGTFATQALAVGEIIAPTSAVINAGGPGFGSINDTLNQNGLSFGYTSGLTNFNAYLASNPTHTVTFGGYEWFGEAGTTSAQVTYNLGGVTTIDALALWNEESSGIGNLSLLSSLDGINFTTFASNLIPTDNTADYPADVFTFSAVTTQYVRFDITNSPQPNGHQGVTFPAAAIGEVAFRTASATSSVPDAGSTALLLVAGLMGLAGLRKRKN